MDHRTRALAAAALLAFLAPTRVAAEYGFVDKLAAAGSLGIPLAEARAIESKLGQLFVVNVDGFGYSGPLALAPGYAALVKRLQVGGVIPHYGSTDIERIRRTNQALADMTREPLLICCDIVRLSGKAGKTARFGDGYVGGFIGKFHRLSDPGYRSLASLNAFVLSALGINVALGPTVDDSTSDARTAARARVMIAELRRFGLEPVLKHFPFLPRGANLHRESPDVKVALRDVEKRAAIFRTLAGESGILMTTHLRDSLVDSRIVTFSPRWIDILRRQTRFKGLLMTDGLLMLANYPDASGVLDGPTAWALSAVLAGHDLLIVEGSAATTYQVFEGLLRVACGKTETGKLLRERIETAAARIALFKKRNEKLLRRQVDVPPSAISDIVSLVPAEGADMKAFHFDTAALERVEKDLRRSALR